MLRDKLSIMTIPQRIGAGGFVGVVTALCYFRRVYFSALSLKRKRRPTVNLEYLGSGIILWQANTFGLADNFVFRND